MNRRTFIGVALAAKSVYNCVLHTVPHNLLRYQLQIANTTAHRRTGTTYSVTQTFDSKIWKEPQLVCSANGDCGIAILPISANSNSALTFSPRPRYRVCQNRPGRHQFSRLHISLPCRKAHIESRRKKCVGSRQHRDKGHNVRQ